MYLYITYTVIQVASVLVVVPQSLESKRIQVLKRPLRLPSSRIHEFGCHPRCLLGSSSKKSGDTESLGDFSGSFRSLSSFLRTLDLSFGVGNLEQLRDIRTCHERAGSAERSHNQHNSQTEEAGRCG